ncbi:MAG: arginase family protein, partial [Alistipes sp.]|nr:arginase family protein [Alistipes sp.]
DASSDMNETVLSQSRHWLAQGKIVGLVGGDHSTAYGMIKAVGERYEEFGVLQIDAHCDLRSAYEGFDYSHASVMYNVLRDVPQLTRLTQVGVREFSRKEYELTRDDVRVEMFCDQELSTARAEGATWREQCDRIVATLPHNVYVSFDIDGLSVECCPHTGTPVPGGLSFNEATYLLGRIVDSGRRIVGFDLVEVVPDIDDRIDAVIAARLLFKLCSVALKNSQTKSII